MHASGGSREVGGSSGDPRDQRLQHKHGMSSHFGCDSKELHVKAFGTTAILSLVIAVLTHGPHPSSDMLMLFSFFPFTS